MHVVITFYNGEGHGKVRGRKTGIGYNWEGNDCSFDRQRVKRLSLYINKTPMSVCVCVCVCVCLCVFFVLKLLPGNE